ncbi:unnamed protein product [Albugo candida]|uniref:Uncharacterized protein n=1 Tax=Albugo candida TaxID=65357 RepID=A0A024FUI3_9STRA|nr:unnamed protein product [Albugo candida]|eukprot:CCI10557.1 unnamed protein product [Albugo candida]
MDESLLHEIDNLIKQKDTQNCVALFDVTSDLALDMLFYYQIVHFAFEFTPVEFKEVLREEQNDPIIRDGALTVAEYGKKIMLRTLISEMDLEYTILYNKLHGHELEKDGEQEGRRKFMLMMLLYHQEVSKLIHAQKLPASLANAHVSKWQYQMKDLDIIKVKTAAKMYYEILEYNVVVSDKVQVCGVEVSVDFRIASPPPKALNLINFLKEKGMPSIVVEQSENSVDAIRHKTKHSEIIAPTPQLQFSKINHYTLYRPGFESVTVKVTYDFGQVTSTSHSGDLYGTNRLNHSRPKESDARLLEAVAYISTLKPCIVFSDTGLYHRILKVMTKGILVVVQNLTETQSFVDELVRGYQGVVDLYGQKDSVSVYRQYINDKRDWRR